MISPKIQLSVLSFAALLAVTSLSAFADSHVRIVRLSYTEGGVEVSRAGSDSYGRAMLNIPIAEGMKLKTADDGKAEVEFENGSTLRIVPESVVEFRELSLRDSGVKVSTLGFTRGTAYVNFAGTKDDEFTLEFAGQKIPLAEAARLRIDINDQNSSLAVFKGLVEVKGPAGVVDVKKNQTISFDNLAQYKLAKNVHQEAWDNWDNQQSDYHERYAAKSYNSYSPYAYGTTDLTYYGNFFNYPGYGMLWSPFFAGAGWDPFMDGAWMFYPGSGYNWISAYPWGWTPYHYGTWVFLPGHGWAWQPGGAWTPVYAQPRVLNAPAGFVVPKAPTSGTSTVLVSRGQASTLSGSKLVVRKNSAGLGVPRGEVENMARVSEKVETHGVVNQRLATASPEMRSSPEMRTSDGRTVEGPSSMPASSSPMPSSHSSGAPASAHPR
jgi:hypothetical protein